MFLILTCSSVPRIGNSKIYFSYSFLSPSLISSLSSTIMSRYKYENEEVSKSPNTSTLCSKIFSGLSSIINNLGMHYFSFLSLPIGLSL